MENLNKKYDSSWIHPKMSQGFASTVLEDGIYPVESVSKCYDTKEKKAQVFNMRLTNFGTASFYTGDPKINRESLSKFLEKNPIKVEIKKNEVLFIF